MNRPDFLKASGLASAGLPLIGLLEAADSNPNITLRIAPVSVEVGPGKVIQTVGYNGSVPSPILRFNGGKACHGRRIQRHGCI